jgi:hypothetical protein
LSLVVLLVALVSTVTAFFGDYAQAEMTAYWFEEGAETLAGRINEFLGSGWNGDRMLFEASGAGRPGTAGEQGELDELSRAVFIERALWATWKSVPFLVGESQAVHLLPADGEWPTVGSAPAAIFVWPYGNWKRAWTMLDVPVEVWVEEGALSQGDRDPEPFTTFLAFYVRPVETAPPALARFQGGVELLDAAVRSVDQGLRVELSWQATAALSDDYTVFVHYMRDQQRIAQSDRQPAGGHYPTDRWHAGDLIHDEHFIPLTDSPDPARDQIIVGLYRPGDGRHLDLLDPAGNPAGAFVVLPLSEVLQ